MDVQKDLPIQHLRVTLEILDKSISEDRQITNL